eukprot:Opistho-2@89782
MARGSRTTLALCLVLLVSAAAADQVRREFVFDPSETPDVSDLFSTATPTATSSPTFSPGVNHAPVADPKTIELDSIDEDIEDDVNVGTTVFSIFSQLIEDEDVETYTGFPASIVYAMCAQFFEFYSFDFSSDWVSEIDEFEVFPQLVSAAFDDDLYSEVLGYSEDDFVIFDAVRYGFHFLPNLRVVTTPSTAHGVWQVKDGDKSFVPVQIKVDYPGWIYLRFKPNANYNGVQTISFAARDIVAYAKSKDAQSATITASLTINPVNDPPVRVSGKENVDMPANPFNITLDPLASAKIKDLIGASYTDIDSTTFGAVVTRVTVSGSNGFWQYLFNSTWVTISTSVTSRAALALGPDTKIRFVPLVTFYETSSITVRAWDLASGIEREFLNSDASVNNAFSVLRVTITSARYGCDSVLDSRKIKDACGTCGGNGSTCAGCDSVAGSNKKNDACGVCGGSNACFGCDNVPNSGKKNDDCGECDGKNSAKDCNGDCRGTAVLNACNICVGGRTGKAATAGMDCHGDCGGSAKLDVCQKCTGGNTGLVAGYSLDCNKKCGGSAAKDECGVCTDIKDKSKKWWIDCDSKCFGNATLDQCNVCSGGSTGVVANKDVDACGKCFSNNGTCLGCDNVPNSGKVRDNCDECDGDNSKCSKVISVTPSYVGDAFTGTMEVIGGGFNSVGAPLCRFTAKIGGGVTTSTGSYVSGGKVLCTLPASTAIGVYELSIYSLTNAYSVGSVDVTVYPSGLAKVSAVQPERVYIGTTSTIVVLGSDFFQASSLVCVFAYNVEEAPATIGAADQVVPATFINSTAVSCKVPTVSKSLKAFVTVSPNGVALFNVETGKKPQVIIARRQPFVETARFSSTGVDITVTFDKSVTEVTSCAAAFTTETVAKFGKNPKCSSPRLTQILINLGIGATVDIGTLLTFKTDALFVRDEDYSDAASGSTPVLIAINPTAPTVSLASVELLGSCDDLTVRYAVQGSVGSLPVTWEWTVSADNAEDTSTIKTLLGTGSNGIVVVGNGNFSFNVQYRISARAINFMGAKSDSVSISVGKVDAPLPQLSILGGDTRKIAVSDFLTINARTRLPSCVDVAKANITYLWTVDLNDVILYNDDTETVSVERFGLVGGNKYVFTVRAEVKGLGSGLVFSTASQTIVVLESTLSLVTSGGSIQTTGTGSAFAIAATCTDDGTADKSCADPIFQWTCLLSTGGPCLNAKGEQILEVTGVDATASSLSIPAGNLQAGSVYVLTASVVSGTRRQTASATVTAVSGTPPIVKVVREPVRPNVGSKIRFRVSVTSSKTVTSAKWEAVTNTDGSGIVDLSNKDNICTNGKVLDKTTLCISENVLTEQVAYKFRYTATSEDGTGSATVSFVTNSGPRNGDIVAVTTTGPIDSSFELRATDWSDPEGDLPLLYKFAYNDANGVSVALTDMLPEAYATVRLPAGVHSVSVVVFDSRGSSIASDTVDITVTTENTAGMTESDFATYIASLLASGDSLLQISAQSEFLTAMMSTLEVLNARSIGCSADILATLVTIVGRLEDIIKNVQLSDPNVDRVVVILQRIMAVYGGCLEAAVLDRLKTALNSAMSASISGLQGSSGSIDKATASNAVDAAFKLNSANGTTSGTFMLESVQQIGTAFSPKQGSDETSTIISSMDGDVNIAVDVQDVDDNASGGNVPFEGPSGCEKLAVPVDLLKQKLKPTCDSVTGNCKTSVAGITVSFKANPTKVNTGLSDKDSFLGFTDATLVDQSKKIVAINGTDVLEVTVCLPKKPTGTRVHCQYFDTSAKKWTTADLATSITESSATCGTKHLSLFTITDGNDTVLDPPVGSYLTFSPGLNNVVEGGAFAATVKGSLGASNQSQSCCTYLWQVALTGTEDWVNVSSSPMYSALI